MMEAAMRSVCAAMSRSVSIRGIALSGVVAAAMALAPAGPAHALSPGAIPLLNGQSFSVNGLTISVSNCTLMLNGVNQASCASYSMEIAPVTGPGASIRIQGVDGGNLFSATRASGDPALGDYDVSFKLDISSTLPTTVTNASLALSGTATGTVAPGYPLPIGTLVSAGEVVAGTSNNGNMTVNLAGSTTANRPFAADTSFSVTKDLALRASQLGVGTLTLAYVGQSYTPAPEPAALSVLAVGAAGAAYLRRRRRQRGQT